MDMLQDLINKTFEIEKLKEFNPDAIVMAITASDKGYEYVKDAEQEYNGLVTLGCEEQEEQ